MDISKNVSEVVLKKAVASDFGLEDHLHVTVLDMKVSLGAKKGDNFVCVMKAVEAKVLIKGEKEERTVHYMAKCMPTNELKASFIQEVNFALKNDEHFKFRIIFAKVKGFTKKN